MIAKYTALKWNKNTISVICDRIDINVTERQVSLLQLTDELEDHLDRGVLYCGNAEQHSSTVKDIM